jgi:hypothetical protein
MSRFTGLTDGDPCYGKDLPDQKEAETGVLPESPGEKEFFFAVRNTRPVVFTDYD